MNAGRIKPAVPPIRDKKRFRRLKTLIAREMDRGERINSRIDLAIGYAFPDGRFETNRADNFRYTRQLLACLRDQDVDRETRRNLLGVARYMRKDELSYRKREKIWL